MFFVSAGTAANVLGLNLLRPFEAVICAESGRGRTQGQHQHQTGSACLLTSPAAY